MHIHFNTKSDYILNNIKNNKSKKKIILKRLGKFIIYGFALAGFGIIAAWAIFKLGFTKNSGTIDKNNRYLLEISNMKAEKASDSTYNCSNTNWTEDYYKILCIAKFYPYNAERILDVMRLSHNPITVKQMIAATEIYIAHNKDIYKEYLHLLQKGKSFTSDNSKTTQNAIPWMNTEEWDVLKQAIIKEKKSIDSAAKVAGIEPRLIVATLIGEQIRLYHSKRELFKSYLGPVKVLVTETQFSLGITGIKSFTASKIEHYIRDTASEFYISPNYEHVLDYGDGYYGDTTARYNRLTNHNHYYSYLYTGLILHSFQKQWQRAGYDISHNPPVLVTLFNLGYNHSIPKANPEIGGAKIIINNETYTFGGLAFDFYYSGELANEFPYYKNKFVD